MTKDAKLFFTFSVPVLAAGFAWVFGEAAIPSWAQSAPAQTSPAQTPPAQTSSQSVRAPSTAEKVVGGPYTVNVGPRSATVMWVVENGKATLRTTPDSVSKTIPRLRTEKIVMDGLKPGT